MRAKDKMNEFMGKTLGIITFFIGELKKPSDSSSKFMGQCPMTQPGKNAEKNASGMQRVTDALGDEFLCPVDKLSDPSFVREDEKRNCVDYSLVSEHTAT